MARRPDPAEVLRFVTGRRRAMVGLLREMVEAESPSGVAGSHGRALAVFEQALREQGCRVTRLAGRTSGGQLYARRENRRRGAALQLLLGHVDTVWPVGSLAEMPFEVDGDVVRGPGVYDMKAGLAMMVLAMQAVRELGIDLPLEPVVLVNSDEEIGSRDSRRPIRRLARRVRRAWVLEPSLGPSGRLKTTRKGVARFTVTVRGRAAHAGLDPGAGASAILELSHVVQQLFALNDPHRGVTVNVGTIDGGLGPNVVAPESRAIVDVRAPSGADASRVEHAIRSLVATTPGTRLEISGGFGRPPLEATPRNRALWRLACAEAGRLGIGLEEGLAGGGSDGSFTSLWTATLDGLGPVGDGAHAAHECIYLDATLERAALVTMLLASPDAPADTGPETEADRAWTATASSPR
jgi:glutamate carboxypeptidase